MIRTMLPSITGFLNFLLGLLLFALARSLGEIF